MKIIILDSKNLFSKRLAERLKGTKHKVFVLSVDNDLKKSLKEIQPDAVYNIGSFGGGVHFVSGHMADVVFKNMQMILDVYQAIALVSPRARVINILSNCSYPADAVIQSEENWFSGEVHESVYAYGNVKRMQYVVSYCYKKQYGIKSINFIIPNHYGPGDYTDPVKVHAINGMIIRMVKAKREGKREFEIWGSGRPVREWGYVDDIVKVLLKGLMVGFDLTYPVNIAQNKGYSIGESAKLIARSVGFKGKLIFNKKYQDGALKKVLDNKKFRKLFPKFKFTDHYWGIEETVKYYESVLKL